MGLTLSEPATAKDTAYCQNSQYRVGSSCMQGWRVKMEDAHTHILSLPDDPTAAFFAVYDGHGGATVSDYLGKHLHKYVTRRPEYKEGQLDVALQQAFLELDEAMLSEDCLREEQAGSTAVVMVIRNNAVHCANVGDSRAVASVHGKAEPLSFDHKPNNSGEYVRIVSAGGYVEYNRVNGNLALSRAFGDYVFKRNEKKSPQEQIVTAYPDIETRQITEDWEFIVIACDGIWDVMTNREVVDYVRQNIAEGYEPEEICESLMMKCLAPDCQMAGLGCDNMTVVIIGLLNGGSYEELGARCAIVHHNNEKCVSLNLIDTDLAESEGGDEEEEEEIETSFEDDQQERETTAAPLLDLEDSLTSSEHVDHETNQSEDNKETDDSLAAS